ncbi:MAG TPA: YdcF family protein [Bryobacteraceae bacterium]|nr:YdcF family protein [Bryobacteraceae bacterium]
MRRPGFGRGLALVLCAAAVLLLAPYWLPLPGRFLVRSSPPIPAGLVVVLAGDASGLRILKAAELVKQGFAPRVLVSGPFGFYGGYECEPAIQYAVSQGYPVSWFIPFRHHAQSTSEEVAVLVAKLREWKIGRVDIVTSDYHTRRAGAEFRRVAGGIDFRVVAAPDVDFRPGRWWATRQSRKTFVIEWMKTLASWVNL